MEILQKPKQTKSKNGDLFIVIKDGQQIALGLNARGNHRPCRLGYFFPISYLRQATKPDDIRLDRQNAIYVKKFGYLKIKDGEWPTIGQLNGFQPDDWPMPKFESTFPDNVTKYISEYDEERLEKCVFYELKSRLPANYDLSFVIKDSLAGADFLAVVLEDMMKSKGLLS